MYYLQVMHPLRERLRLGFLLRRLAMVMLSD